MKDPRDDQGWADDDGIFLYLIAAEEDLMNAVEHNLRSTGQIDCVHQLIKFTQDVGIEMIGGPKTDLSALGEFVAGLHKNFEPVTPDRLRCLYYAHDLLTDTKLKERLQNLLDQCPQPAGPKVSPAGPEPKITR
jgi:hypothetical protein